MLAKVQKDLIYKFPELGHRRFLFEYYVSLQSPEKQKKLIKWWQEKIIAAIQITKQIFISPSDLEVIFSIDGLKPIPLPSILEHMENLDKIQWHDKPSTRQEEESHGWMAKLRSIFNFLTRRDVSKNRIEQKLKKKLSVLSCNKSKIIPKDLKDKNNQNLKNIIQKYLKQHSTTQKSASLQDIERFLVKNMTIGPKSISLLLQSLHKTSWMNLQRIEGRLVLFRVQNQVKFENDNWLEQEKVKFCLYEKIGILQQKIDRYSKKEDQLKRKAKEFIGKDETRARKYGQQVIQIRKFTQSLNNHLKALQQNLNQFQLNEVTKMSMSSLTSVQQLLKTNMVDENALDDILITNSQIRASQDMMRDKFSDLVDDDEVDDLANDVFAQLEREVVKDKNKNKEKERMAAKNTHNITQKHSFVSSSSNDNNISKNSTIYNQYSQNGSSILDFSRRNNNNNNNYL